MTERTEITLPEGRLLVAYDHRPPQESGEVMFWHHGSPHSGDLIAPLIAFADARGIRLVTYARPSYGGSTPAPGRDIAACITDVAAVADTLGIERFSVVGSSGGGPHTIACAALLPDRVSGAVSFSSPAPFRTDLDWFAGMASETALRAARDGRPVRAALVEEFNPDCFTKADWAALSGPWGALGEDAGPAGERWPDGLVDDDVAITRPWGFELGETERPVLVVQGGADRMIPASHATWLTESIPTAELWLRPKDGHVSVLSGLGVAWQWLTEIRDS